MKADPRHPLSLPLRALLGAALRLWLILHTGPADGQTVNATTGSITGTIIDASGAAVPGVTVVISSDALIGSNGTRTATTDRQGLYRFPAVPPGEYVLVCSHEGFATVTREGIHVGLGFSATVDVTLTIAAVHEDVSVPRDPTVADRRATVAAIHFDSHALADLPGSRSMAAIFAATPAVQVSRFEVGGNTQSAGQQSAYGTPGQNRPMVEGLNVSGILDTGFSLNYGSFDEVAVGTAAHGAEWPMAGVQMQFIVKSGGNRYRATLYADYENQDWQSFNVDADQILRTAQGGGLLARDVNRLSSYHDVNADAGGYVKRDVLWWYGSIRDQDVSARAVNFPVRPRQTRITSYSGKTTYQPIRNNTFIAFAQLGGNHQPDILSGFTLGPTTGIHLSEDSTAEQRAWGWLWKGEWNAVVNDRIFIELRAGRFGADRPETPNGTSPRFEDVSTLLVTGGNRNWESTLRREQLLGSTNYFKDGWFGNHQFKIGGEIFRRVQAEIWNSAYPGDVLHVLRDRQPSEVVLFQTPSKSENGDWTYTAYASDSWRVNNRLTINAGTRVDRYRVFLPAQEHPAGRFNPTAQRFPAVDEVIAWNLFAPRIGVVHDVHGNGRTILKLSYGRYWVPPGTDVGATANSNSPQWWTRHPWKDLNGNGVWDPDEEGPPTSRRGGATTESLDRALRLPYVDEMAAWVERELSANFGIRTGVVWRGERQHRLRQNTSWPIGAFSVPVMVPDPGPDGQRGTADDPPAIVAYNLRDDLLSAQQYIVRNVPQSDTHYWSWDVTATKRYSDRWSLVAGFVHTWNSDHANAYLGQPVRQNAFPLTPNDLTNAGAEGRYDFRMWSAKVYGTYVAPWGLRVTPLLRHQSGQPFGRTVVARLNYASNVTILAEPIGTRRMDNVTLFDVRVEKRFHLPRRIQVAGLVDVFNLFNGNPEDSTSWSSGAFLRPLDIVAPRIVRIGTKLEW
ncbi:MAG TPA: TonB-dependent receptor [Vicinamibacterales bacterium]|nr:TonB-dependent receptor [Vicinamibacterales bacterium]